jgi:hypothetical protein
MPRKPSPQGTPRLRLSASFLESLEKDCEKHRGEVIEALRKESPRAYAELLGRLVMTADPPEGGGLKDCQSMQDIGRRLLKGLGRFSGDYELNGVRRRQQQRYGQLELSARRGRLRYQRHAGP